MGVEDCLVSAREERGLVEFPASTDGTIDGDLFQQFWRAAHANLAVTGVKLPCGEYTVIPPESASHHLDCSCAESCSGRPFCLDLSNVELVLSSTRHGGISLGNAVNVRMHGPCTLRHSADAWPYGQAVLTSVSADGMEWKMTGHRGFPNDRAFLTGQSLNAIVWDGDTSRMIEPGCDDLATEAVRKAGANEYTFRLPYARDDIRVGNIITARGPDSCSAVSFDHCQWCTLSGITIHSASCFGFYEAFCTGTTYRKNTITPWTEPLQPGGPLPLLATNADGIHASDDRQGPTVIDSTFDRLGDDAIAITGHFSIVAAVSEQDRTLTLVQSMGGLAAGPGDLIRTYGQACGDLGTAVISHVEEAQNPLPAGTRIDAWGCCTDEEGFTKIRVEDWPEAWSQLGLGCCASYPGWCGSGFQAIGNTVGNTRGRGVLCKASKATIACNAFAHMKGPAIAVGPEMAWREADFVQDVTVRGNSVQSLAPGIFVGACHLDSGRPVEGRMNRNITISGNRISDCLQTPIVITSAAGVSIQDNTVRNALGHPGTRCHDWEVEGKLLLVMHADQVAMSGNLFQADSPAESAADYANPIELIDVAAHDGTCPSERTTGPVEAA